MAKGIGYKGYDLEKCYCSLAIQFSRKLYSVFVDENGDSTHSPGHAVVGAIAMFRQCEYRDSRHPVDLLSEGREIVEACTCSGMLGIPPHTLSAQYDMKWAEVFQFYAESLLANSS